MTAFEWKTFFVWRVTYICVHVTQAQFLPTSSKHVSPGMRFLGLGIGGLSHQSCMSLHIGTNNIVGGSIICHHIHAHLDNYNTLPVFQHGFRSGHSCDSQLLSTVHLMSIFDRKKWVDVAVLDFSKGFDVMPHHRLLGKLWHCGINGRALEWVADFLSGRTQRVIVDGAYSRWSPVHSGVPQGTVLGPLLFLIYLNDLPDSVNSTVRLFADDRLVYRKVGSWPSSETWLPWRTEH